ncbi:MAG TPA: bifunctional 4-hydroxy-2-oxoglutarate aldolase/2-dehydro-3-deoxy-phosphogluconate aldolase, partial [Candidatus Ventrisoma faecale]|nr:bifunctional 4-hydroxy-2-oxoglutarate aldolase/2-dehydro-3-deoxy-phosphogluconate aldolase [Candidatus Ventrisoma faecale]
MRELFKTHRLCAILRNVPDSQVLNYAEAAYAGGIRLFEVAMNTETGDRQIRKLRDAFAGREVYIGAGTVIDEDRCLRAADAGAQFFLTPSAARSIMEYCRETGMPILPGVFTATDVGICLEYGYDTMKLFPAGDMPLGYVKSLKGPFDGTDYVAVGGVNLENIKDFLA